MQVPDARMRRQHFNGKVGRSEDAIGDDIRPRRGDEHDVGLHHEVRLAIENNVHRRRQHFSEPPASQSVDELMLFHEYVAASAEEREGRTPFIWALTKERKLRRLKVSAEMVELAAERQQFWSQLRQLAGLEIPVVMHDTVVGQLEAEFDQRADALRLDYEAKVAELKASLPTQIARRLAEGLLRNAGSSPAVAQLLASLPAVAIPAAAKPSSGNGSPAKIVLTPTPAKPDALAKPAAPAKPDAPGATAVADDETLVLEAYIDSARCTTCNECTNLNNRMFAYNADKQAYVKDARAGTFQQLVVAAERCPVSIIHPGSPLNPKEKDLAKWVKRAEKFN